MGCSLLHVVDALSTWWRSCAQKRGCRWHLLSHTPECEVGPLRGRTMAGRHAKPPKTEKEKAREKEKREKKRVEAAAAAAATIPEEVPHHPVPRPQAVGPDRARPAPG